MKRFQLTPLEYLELCTWNIDRLDRLERLERLERLQRLERPGI